MLAAVHNDAELVGESLSGNRDAFGHIVSRYQSLVCSLAYSATGSLSQSEDLAQETFVTAWQRLAELREPEKLRAWLCGIARNLINNSLRRQGHEPSHHAEPLEEIAENHSPEPLPAERAIGNEEAAILWRSLERIPEIYREPLVLFYREHQSIEAVARELELNEDAVKQRLSRGRKMLQEQVLAFVEGALERTKPDKAFTLGVLAALPLIATTAKAATATVAIKGGSTVKATTSLAMLGAVLTASVLFELSLLAFLAFTGGCIGYMMGRACARSPGQLQNVTRFWRAMAVGFGVFLVLPWLSAFCLHLRPESHPGLWHGMTLWLGLLYLFVPAVLVTWIWRWWRELHKPEMATEQRVELLKKPFAIWLTLGMILPACFLVISLCAVMSERTWMSRFISEAQVQKIVTGRKDATYTVDQNRSGSKTLWIKLPEEGGPAKSMLALLAKNGIVTEPMYATRNDTNGSKSMWMRLPESSRRVEFIIPADESTLALLARNGIAYSTSVEGRDYDVLGLPWNLVGLLSFFIAPMGAVIVLRRPWRYDFRLQEIEIRRDERAAKNAFKAFAVSVALVLLTAGILLGLVTRWHVRTLSSADVQKMAADLKAKGANFIVYEFSNGTKELCIQPNFVAPADAATLSILAENGINYMTLVQGRDFGHNTPQRGMASLLISVLIGGAGIILWRVSPKAIAVVMALMMIVVGILVDLRTPWHMQSISTAAARTMIVEHPTARFLVVEYSDGSTDLWITPPGSRHYPGYVATADDSVLALLAENNITFNRVFGFWVPRRGTALLYISSLAAGSVAILWWAWKKRRTLPAPAKAGA